MTCVSTSGSVWSMSEETEVEERGQAFLESISRQNPASEFGNPPMQWNPVENLECCQGSVGVRVFLEFWF